MRVRVWGVGLVWIGFSGLAGCGSDGSGGAKGTGSVEEADYPAKLASAACGAMAACCQAHKFPHYGPDCEARISASVQDTITSRESAGAVYAPVNAGKCIDAWVSLYSGCGSNDDVDPTETCDHVFLGTVPEGGDCTTGLDCLDSTLTCFNGSCEQSTLPPDVSKAAHAKLGDPCNGACRSGALYRGVPVTECSPYGDPSSLGCFASDHLTCDPTNLTCVVLPKVGQPCTVQSGCEAGEFCDNGTCAAQRDTGPCSGNPGYTLIQSACKDTSYCDPQSMVCLALKAEGAACAQDVECAKGYCTEGVCGPPAPVNADTCAGTLQ
jgi:hypothetical protein